MNFKINERVLWRNERNSLMLLHPVSKRLLIYGKGISDAVSKNGIVRTEDLPNFSDALLRDGIVLPYEGSLENESFGSDPEISAPLNVTIQVTNRCNLKCAHCHRVDKGQIDIHYERLTQIIDELAEMRVFNVNVSGGEPLMYDRIFDVVAYVASKGMKVTMSTNLMLWNAGIAKRFFDMGLRQLHISLDSADENQHNKIRWSELAYRQTLKNLEVLKKTGIEFTLVTTLTSQSPEEYAAIIDLAYSLGASGHKTNALVPQWQGSDLDVEYYRNPDLLRQYAETFQRKKSEYSGKMAVVWESMFTLCMPESEDAKKPDILKFPCPAGILTCAITEKWELLSCPFYSDLSVGNIYEKSFSNLWKTSVLLGKIRKFKTGTGSGCQARGYGISRTIDGKDPFVYGASGNPETKDFAFYDESAGQRQRFIAEIGHAIGIEWEKGNREFYELAHERLVTVGSALEIGTGTGIVPKTLGHTGVPMVSVDFSENMLDIARKNCSEYPQILFKKENLNSLSFDDRTFGLVIKRLVPDCLGEIFRVLGEDGDFVNFTNGENDGKELKDLFGLPRHESVEQYRRRLQQAGFQIVSEREFTFSENYPNLDILKSMLRIAPILGDFPGNEEKYLDSIAKNLNPDGSFTLTRHKFLTHAKK